MSNLAYYRPQILADAVSKIGAEDNCKILAGGTDLIVQLKEKKIDPQMLVDITSIPELKLIEEDSDGSVRIGAAVTMARISEDKLLLEKYPVLSMAARTVGSNQIRQQATLAGNLCNASPSADTIPSLLVLDARIRIAGPLGLREVPVAEFITGPGKTLLASGEIVQDIVLPAYDGNCQGIYLKYSRRRAVDLAMVGAAVTVFTNDENNICKEARIALGAVAAVPFRVLEAEALCRGKELTPELIREAAMIAKNTARPISDIRASADYRFDLVEALVSKGLTMTWTKMQAGNHTEGGK